jgi:hypothetical protein
MLRLVSYAYMPSPLPRQVQWSLFARASPLSAAFPCVTVRSAPAITFSGPAQRSLALRPARSPSHQRDPLHRKLRRFGYPRRRFGCYRVERTSSRVGVAPTEVQRLSRRTVTPISSYHSAGDRPVFSFLGAFTDARPRGVRLPHSVARARCGTYATRSRLQSHIS